MEIRSSTTQTASRRHFPRSSSRCAGSGATSRRVEKSRHRLEVVFFADVLSRGKQMPVLAEHLREVRCGYSQYRRSRRKLTFHRVEHVKKIRPDRPEPVVFAANRQALRALDIASANDEQTL